MIELFTVTVRFDNANDVALSELRVELMYASNEAADRFFHTTGQQILDSRQGPSTVVSALADELRAGRTSGT